MTDACCRRLPPESVPVKIRQYMDALGVAPRTVSTAVQRRFDSCRVLHKAMLHPLTKGMDVLLIEGALRRTRLRSVWGDTEATFRGSRCRIVLTLQPARDLVGLTPFGVGMWLPRREYPAHRGAQFLLLYR